MTAKRSQIKSDILSEKGMEREIGGSSKKKDDEFRGLRTEKRFQGSAKATTIGVLPL